MAYAWAGPMGMCMQEAGGSTKVASRVQAKPSRSGRLYEAAAFSTSGPLSTSTPAAAGHAQTSNRTSPSRSRPVESQTNSSGVWGFWGSLSRSTSYLKQLPRAFTLTSSPSTSSEANVQLPAPETEDSKAGQDAAKEPRPLLHDFLSKSDQTEVSYAALLADMSDLAYDISLLKADELLDRHNLQLVSTSNSQKAGPITREAWFAQVKEQRRSMSPTPEPAAAAADDTQPQLSDVGAAVAHALLSGEISSPNAAPHESGAVLTPSVSLVAMSTLEESSPRTSLSGHEDTSLQVPIVTFLPSPPTSPRSAGSQQASAFHQLDIAPAPDSPQAETSSSPVVPYTATHAQVELTSSQAGALTTSTEPPAAWFACDDPITKIRYLVIQGSTSLDHWQINLQFEPVIFEDPKLGVRVHRGVYMAALQLYDDLVPLVRQHLATSSFASITFTGHSLGGSLATVLMLLMVSRGVLPPDCVSPTYTFGAPAVFCGGAGAFSAPTRCHECGLDCPEAKHAAEAARGTPPPPPCSRRPSGLFAQVGLGEEHIVNVIMHRDIVPRAFACDYMAVADLLVQWMPSFKSLATLQGPANTHKSLYSFLGRVTILQPDTSCSFVHASDAKHPHLPSAPGLYRLVAPAPRLRVHALNVSFDLPVPTSGPEGSFGDDLYHLGLGMDDASMIASMATVGRPRPYTPAPVHYATVEEDDEDDTRRAGSVGRSARGAEAASKAGRGGGKADNAVGPPKTLKDAVLHFMNNPHPLTTLTEYAAYGPNGSISRYHNPRNYTLGLLALLGKAPHQQLPATSSQAPVQSRQGSPDAGAAHNLPQCLADDATCALQHELAMSPEARRLIRQPGTPSPARSRVSSGRAQRAPSAGKRPPANGAAQQQQQVRSAQPATAAPRMPMLPGLGSLPASLGSLLGYRTNDK